MSEFEPSIHGFTDDQQVVEAGSTLRSGRQLVIPLNPLREPLGDAGAESVGSSRESLVWDGINQNPSFVNQGSTQINRANDDSRWSTSTHRVSVPSIQRTRTPSGSDTGSHANTVMPAHGSMNNSTSSHSPNMKREILLLVEAVEEDIVPFQRCNVPPSTLSKLIAEAQSLKVKLRQLVIVFQETEQDDDLLERIDNAKKSIRDFLVSAEAKMCDLQQSGAVAPETRAIDRNPERVRIVEASAKRSRQEACKLIDTYIRIADISKSGEDGVRRAMDMLSLADDTYTDLMDSFKSLGRAALDQGCEQVALKSEEDKDHVRQFKKEAKEAISVGRRVFGLIDSGSRRIGLADLKPPEFSGDQSKPLDFFSFKTEWDDYVKLKSLSVSESLKVLLRTSLSGPAKEAAYGLGTLEEVWNTLRDIFGNPRRLIDQRIRELTALGDMPKRAVADQRDWVIKMMAKLKSIHTCCRKHGLLEELYHGLVIESVIEKLPYDFKRELKKEKIYNRAGDTFRITRAEYFDCLLEYLQEKSRELTIEVNMDMVQPRTEKAAAGTRPSEPQAPLTRRPKTYVSVEQEPVSEPEVSKPASTKRPPQREQIATVKNSSKPLVDCPLCPSRHSHLFYCQRFIEAAPDQRFKLIKECKSCSKCLRLGVQYQHSKRFDWWRGHKAYCSDEFLCGQDACKTKNDFQRFHMLVCTHHLEENKSRERAFIAALDAEQLPAGVNLSNLGYFYMYFSHATLQEPMRDPAGAEVIGDVMDSSLFMLQTIVVKGEQLLVFYDSGCGGAAISDRAHSILDTETVREGPTSVDVAGGQVLTLPHGDERFLLDLLEPGKKATITALRMPEVTSIFPQVDLRPAFKDLKESAAKCSRSLKLPDIGITVGGRPVDIVLGARYFKYFPVLVYSLPSGLGIYRTSIKGIDGVTGILGGPHKAWNNPKCSSQYMNPRVYFMEVAQAWSSMQLSQERGSELVACSVPQQLQKLEEVGQESAGVVHEYQHCLNHAEEFGWAIPSSWNLEQTVHQQRLAMTYPIAQAQRSPITTVSNRLWDHDEAVTEVMYRCPACRNCNQCRKGDRLEAVSFKEEREQAVIDESIEYLPTEARVVAFLPFMFEPDSFLSLNRAVAERVLVSQLKKFAKYPVLRDDALRAHAKMLTRGHVKLLDNLTNEEMEAFDRSPGCGTFIPWRTVQKNDSLSTPCRIVFDASATTATGRSLNSILAKGENRLVLLHHMLVRFRLYAFALTADISMCYNGTKLRPEHFKWQQYLWKEGLEPTNPTVVMVITTIIYGVVSSGNQSKASIDKLADYFVDNVSKDSLGAKVLKEDTYVDDIATSWASAADLDRVKREVTQILAQGSMEVKGYTVSGQPPDEAVSADGTHVLVCGYWWQPVRDLLSLNINLPVSDPATSEGLALGLFGTPFTRRTVTSIAARVFDPLGLATPIISQIKVAVHGICMAGHQWDDPLPKELLPEWEGHVRTIKGLGAVMFDRAVIPQDAVTTELELIVSSDASESVAVTAVHARILLRDGSYRAQLIAAKSKVVRGLTVPRAELKAAVMGAVLAAVVRKNFGPACAGAIHVTDSAICMFWLNQDERPLQVAVRNAVIEILRFTARSQWFHIESPNNIADLGTRRACIDDIKQTSDWQRGKPWMRLPFVDMPIRSAQQLTLNGEEKRAAALEMRAQDISGHHFQFLSSKVADRYAVADYLLDPCRFHWDKVGRILGLVVKFVQCAAGRVKESLVCYQAGQSTAVVKVYQPHRAQGNISLEEVHIESARQYYFRKATQELKNFQPAILKQGDFLEQGGIIYYTGRVVDGQKVLDVARVMFDLGPLSFVRPAIDRYSPIAYSVMIHIHWSQAHHLSAVATLRKSREIVYILRGRDLADEIVSSCVFCKRFKRRLVQVEFGKLHQSRLTIAPPFYLCQVDLFGPFAAFCEHNHRSTVKVWGVVFKDPASLAVWVAAMPAYSTEAFVMAYNRFAARFCHPAKLYIDAGGQLIKACQEMKLSMQDLVGQLGGNFGVAVDYEVCSVGGHNEHGVVERSIREVRKLFQTIYESTRLSVLGLETAFAFVSNELNNLPIGLGSRYTGLDDLDLITPARLIFGRASTRAMSGFCQIEKPTKLLEAMDAVFDAWWKVWAEQRLVDWVPQPAKWKKSNESVKVGDVVLFPRVGSEQAVGRPVWRLGRVVLAGASKRDGKVRKVEIEYKNSEEVVFRKTTRAVREIAVLHGENDLEIYEELNRAARDSDKSYHMNAM